ncbi:hypothetical protein SESBI_49015 [Sesbania bispinosa]|nr:hypothetical protein SESBI_49015 [Sesbania bispinosa]
MAEHHKHEESKGESCWTRFQGRSTTMTHFLRRIQRLFIVLISAIISTNNLSFEEEKHMTISRLSKKSKEMDDQCFKSECQVETIQSALSNPNSPKHIVALKLQKVYKSFRTRRKLADCAILVEQSWWKLLDFAELKRSSISLFDIEKHETAISRWSLELELELLRLIHAIAMDIIYTSIMINGFSVKVESPFSTECKILKAVEPISMGASMLPMPEIEVNLCKSMGYFNLHGIIAPGTLLSLIRKVHVNCLDCGGSCKLADKERCPKCNENGLVICPVCA